jgi:hypothetical protein
MFIHMLVRIHYADNQLIEWPRLDQAHPPIGPSEDKARVMDSVAANGRMPNAEEE